MGNIDKYILAYLFANHKVFLGNIGGFAVEELPAFYNNDANTFIPPTIKLYFVQTMRGNNTDFLFFLSHQLGIPFQQAKKDFDTYVLSIIQELKEQGNAKVGILGQLEKKEGVIEFIPSSYIRKLERFGLEEIPVSTNIKPENIVTKVKSYTTPTTKIGKYVAAASLILSFIMYPTNKIANQSEASIIDISNRTNILSYNLPQKEKETLSQIEKVFEIKKNLIPTNNKNTTELPIPKPQSKATIKQNNNTHDVKVTNNTVAKKSAWGVVLGAFKNEHNASKLIKTISLSEEIQVIKVKGLFRVIAGNFASKQEAKQFLQQLKKQGKSGWVCKY